MSLKINPKNWTNNFEIVVHQENKDIILNGTVK